MAIAEIVRPHGVHGAVKARILTDFPDRFGDLAEVQVRDSSRRRLLRISESRILGEWVLLRFEEIRSRDEAEALRGAFLEIDANTSRPLSAGSFYIHEIVGLEVVSLTGEFLGTIKEVLKTGANDVYVVNSEKGTEILIPATREVVRSVDLETGSMTVAMIPGLLEEE